MNEQPIRSNHKNKTNKVNGWKWAFFGLLAFIIAGLIYFALSIQPVSYNETNIAPIEQNEELVVLSTSVTKEDAETIINTYLKEAVGEEFNDYRVALTDHLEIHGYIEVFGLDVPFTLDFMPYVLENGNIQLRGEAVELANFSLPVSAVMSLFARQVDLPEFIGIDSEKQIIVIHLNEMTQDFSFAITADRIDLQENEIRLNLTLNQGTISDSIQSNLIND